MTYSKLIVDSSSSTLMKKNCPCVGGREKRRGVKVDGGSIVQELKSNPSYMSPSSSNRERGEPRERDDDEPEMFTYSAPPP